MKASRGTAKKKASSGDREHSGFSEPKTVYAHAPGKTRKVKFGEVTVWGEEPTPEQVTENVEASQAALRRMAQRIIRPGVSLRRRKGVPYYHVDDDDPAVIIRTLDGVVERGFFADGEFKKQR
jgi:hypothetical protein